MPKVKPVCGETKNQGGIPKQQKAELWQKVTLNPALEAIHGKVGDLVFKRYPGEEIVAKLPDRTGIEPTAIK